VEPETAVRPVVEAIGLELVEVTFTRESGRPVLRVIVDDPSGVDLDRIAELSEKISRRLDLEGFSPGPYSLEVSSPGIERALRTPSDYVRHLGRTVKVKTLEPIEGSRVHTGELASFDGETVSVSTEDRRVRLPIGLISSARTVADWDAELKRSNG
jgi:ribosome maturation factor RimP